MIFLDLKLPTMNGLETCLAIREIDAKATVIMMTAFRSEMADFAEKALENNAYAFLKKPLEMDHVFNLLGQVRQGLHTD